MCHFRKLLLDMRALRSARRTPCACARQMRLGHNSDSCASGRCQRLVQIGFSILRSHRPSSIIPSSPIVLLSAFLPPIIIALLAFRSCLLPDTRLWSLCAPFLIACLKVAPQKFQQRASNGTGSAQPPKANPEAQTEAQLPVVPGAKRIRGYGLL